MNTGEKNSLLDDVSVNDDRYLVFRIGGQLFGTPILSIREIVQSISFKRVLNPQDFYLGLANLRGQIVGVIDLGIRLDLETSKDRSEGFYLVFDVGGSCIAGYVSDVEAVVAIAEWNISANPLVDVRIPTKALIGIAQIESGMLPIVQLAELIQSNERF